MQNRWFHRPTLHSPGPGREKKVGWLELFYDLIFVATFIQLGNALSANVSVNGFLGFAAMFVPLWYTWTGFTFFANRFNVDDAVHRGMVFLQMFGIGAMAVLVEDVFAGETFGFALAYAGVRFMLVAIYVRAYLQVDQAKELNRLYAAGFGIGACLWLASAFVPAPWVFVLWGGAMLFDIAVPLNARGRALMARHPPDVLHMSERYGLLTIIVLGESFVKLLTWLSEHGLTLTNGLMAALTLLITCSLWWIYFDDVAGSRIRKGRLTAIFWVWAHLPMAIAVTAVGVSIKKAVSLVDPNLVAPAKYRLLLCGTLALALLSVGIIDAVTERRQAELSDKARVNMRLASGVLVLLLVPAGAYMSAVGFLALVAAAGIVQVVFDISMAPTAADPQAAHHEHREVFVAPRGMELEKPAEEAESAAPRRRWDLSDAVRKGTPSELRRDLYFHLMEGSWLRIFGTLVTTFLVVNLVFAALYMLEPGSVGNARAGTFLDAFFFSVQTISTIGYGTLTPTSDWANWLVTLEAVVGIVGIALSTGLFFAKASRPESSVLFSRVVLINRRHGKPTLTFRVGNARGNDVVEAKLSVAVVMDEVTPEGHNLRRLHDLELVRKETPLFALSWSVFHVIDESSPLHGLTEAALKETLFAMVVTMTGFDATYSQTTHARNVYYPENFRFDHRFVDVISTLEDGRLMIDYELFHNVEPMPG